MNVEHKGGFLIIGETMIKTGHIITAEPIDDESLAELLNTFKSKFQAKLDLMQELAKRGESKPESDDVIINTSFSVGVFININSSESRMIKIKCASKEEQVKILKEIRDKLAI